MVNKIGITAVLNASLADEMLIKAARSLENREQILSTIGRYAQDWERQVFETNGAIAGKAWVPLAASTVAAKGNDRPDVRTGELMRQLTSSPRMLKSSVQLRGESTAKFLATGRYYKQDPKPGGNMPRRNPAPKPPKARLGRLMAELLDGVMDAAR